MLALEAHILINRRRSPSHAMLLRILRPCAADRHTPAFSSRAAASSLPERACRERPEVQATRAGYHPRICVECRLRPAGAHRSLSFSIIYGLPISSGLIRRGATRTASARRPVPNGRVIKMRAKDKMHAKEKGRGDPQCPSSRGPSRSERRQIRYRVRLNSAASLPDPIGTWLPRSGTPRWPFVRL
jgi:hypothetical protein